MEYNFEMLLMPCQNPATESIRSFWLDPVETIPRFREAWEAGAVSAPQKHQSLQGRARAATRPQIPLRRGVILERLASSLL